MGKPLIVSHDLICDMAVFINGLAEQIDREPVAELRLGHPVVKELLALAERMHEKEPNS